MLPTDPTVDPQRQPLALYLLTSEGGEVSPVFSTEPPVTSGLVSPPFVVPTAAPDLVTEPLTAAEVKERVDENKYIRGVVAVDVGDIIEGDIETLNDLACERLVREGGYKLQSISYRIVGYSGDDLHILVMADASELLAEIEEEEEGADEAVLLPE